MKWGKDVGFVSMTIDSEFVQCDDDTLAESPMGAFTKSRRLHAQTYDKGVEFPGQEIYLVMRFPPEHVDGYLQSAESMAEDFEDTISDNEVFENFTEHLDFVPVRRVMADMLERQIRRHPDFPFFHVWKIATITADAKDVFLL